MALRRQLVGFGLVGGVQLIVDWAAFVALTLLGVAVVPANVAGRIAGASLGFWLNGRYTFARADGAGPSRHQGLRFALFWIGTTVASTFAMRAIDGAQGLQMAWLLKPLVEGLLAALGFLAGRYWIYRGH